jgi:hypothetical protein
MLLKMSPFDSIQHLDATAFGAIRNLWLGWFAGTRPWEDVSTQTRLRFERVFEEHVGTAADAAVIQYASAVVAEMEAVRAGRPDVCVALVVGEPVEALDAAETVIPYKLQQDRGAAYERIFSTAAEEPQAPPRERQVGYLFDRVTRALWRKHGSQVEILTHQPIPSGERLAACDMYLAYFREILAREPDESGRMLRWLYGKQLPDTDAASAEGPAESLPAIIPKRRERK